MRLPLRPSALLVRPAARRSAGSIRHGSQSLVNSDEIAAARVARTAIGRLCAAAAVAALGACGDASAVPDHLRIAGAEPERGRTLIQAYGCGTCHHIGGVRGARGTVGPALDDFAQ